MFLTVGPETGHLNVLAALLIMWVAAKLMAEIFERLRQPSVVGEILAGVIIGAAIADASSPANAARQMRRLLDQREDPSPRR